MAAEGFAQALTAYGLSKKAGLKHVRTSVPHFAAKYAIEEAIRAGGMPLRFCGQGTSFRMSAGSSRAEAQCHLDKDLGSGIDKTK